MAAQSCFLSHVLPLYLWLSTSHDSHAAQKDIFWKHLDLVWAGLKEVGRGRSGQTRCLTVSSAHLQYWKRTSQTILRGNYYTSKYIAYVFNWISPIVSPSVSIKEHEKSRSLCLFIQSGCSLKLVGVPSLKHSLPPHQKSLCFLTKSLVVAIMLFKMYSLWAI